MSNKENRYQREIRIQLEDQGYYVVKLIQTTKNWIGDLLVMGPPPLQEVFFVEAKVPGKSAGKKQRWRGKEIYEATGRVTYEATSYKELMQKKNRNEYIWRQL